ncbi:MAG: hypothetical protein ACRDTR_08135 [Rubrobacter sp.]
MERVLKWVLPVLALAGMAFVWLDVLSLRGTLLVVVSVEALLLVVAGRQLFVAFRRYRAGRTSGLDPWRSFEESLALLLPGKVARIVVLEPRLWVCLGRWISRRTGTSEREFGYHKRSQMGLILVMLVFTTPVELLVVELLAPWTWLRVSLLVLGLYALVWMFGLYASLVTLPHRLEEHGLRLRYGALAEGFVPLSEIAAVERARRRAPGPGDGLQTDPGGGGIYLSAGGRTDLTLRLHSPQSVRGLFRNVQPARTIHLAADDPERMASKLRERIGGGTLSKPPALA